MGCGASAESKLEASADTRISKQQTQNAQEQRKVIKLLLLGAGESGKSTLFQQIQLVYGTPWTEEELKYKKSIVYLNVLQNFHAVLDYLKTAEIALGDMEEPANRLLAVSENADVSGEVADLVKTLWASEVVQQAWTDRSKYQVLDCLEYYCADIDRLSQADYIPTVQDVLHARVRTSGILEQKFEIDGIKFAMIDVGGQRNERKKWMGCFEDVTALFFVAAINEYDQVLFEDSKTGRIQEALTLFGEVANNVLFADTPIILFLNKRDLFEEKIRRVPFRVAGTRFDDFEGPYAEQEGVNFDQARDACFAYLERLFASQQKNSQKEIYTHFSCATDTTNVNSLFNASKDIVLMQTLNTHGFKA